MAESCEACWVGGGEHQADCPTLRQDWPANLGQKLRSHIGAGASASLQAAQQLIDSLVLQLHQSEKYRVEQTKELVALRDIESKLNQIAVERDLARKERDSVSHRLGAAVEVLERIRYGAAITPVSPRALAADALKQLGVERRRQKCENCGKEIDPTTCGCGSPIDHPWDGHSPIPMGCDCGREA